MEDPQPSPWSSPLAVGAITVTAVAGIGLMVLFSSRTASTAEPTNTLPPGPGTQPPTNPNPNPTPSAPPTVPDDIEFGEVAFPPERVGPQWERLKRLARRAEEVTGITGLFSYLLATADRESSGVPTAMNTETDGKPAFKLFCREFNYDGRFKSNPWRPATCDASDPLASRWAYSGGWFATMTSTALATRDKRGHNHDPARVFDPPFAVAYATDLVMRLRTGFGAETWGDIRAGWALPKWSRPDSTAQGKARVLERFDENLRAVASRGADPDLAGKPVDTSKYPGFTATLHHLLEADGRTGAHG